MSTSRNSRAAQPKPASAVDPEMLAQYRRAARAPTTREEIRTMMALVDDYQTLTATGNALQALGAGLDLVDVCLRIAATPACNAKERQHKAGFFALHFHAMVTSFDHGHVARIADATVATEQALATRNPTTRQ